MKTKQKPMYPHRCRICGKTYHNAHCGKKPGMCCAKCKSVDVKISGRMKLYPLKDVAALKKHLQLMLKGIDQAMGDQQRMIDLLSSYEWEVLIELCAKDWPFLEGCSEKELEALAQLVDVAEDLLDLPAKMPPAKMPNDVDREFNDVLYPRRGGRK